jgi:DNA repair protein RadA/Sms
MPANGHKCIRCKRWSFSDLSQGDEDGTVLLIDVPEAIVPRLQTGPWDVNFGSPPGLPTDSVTLLGGEPGVGKSTIALQWSSSIACSPEATGREVLYLGAEENARQVKARAVRLQLPGLDKIRIVPLERMGDISLDRILTRKLCGGVVDSIPGFTNDPDQAVEIAAAFKGWASKLNLPFVLINHITKDGDQAGLMKLQHAVDISLEMTKAQGEMIVMIDPFTGQSEKVHEPRTLRTEKSRYGPSGTETYYAMTGQGLAVKTLSEDEDSA